LYRLTPKGLAAARTALAEAPSTGRSQTGTRVRDERRAAARTVS
jgi:hypothetical protein